MLYGAQAGPRSFVLEVLESVAEHHPKHLRVKVPDTMQAITEELRTLIHALPEFLRCNVHAPLQELLESVECFRAIEFYLHMGIKNRGTRPFLALLSMPCSDPAAHAARHRHDEGI